MQNEREIGDVDAGYMVFGQVFAVANRLQRVLDVALPEVTTKQWWLMVILSRFEEPPTLGELAKAADTSYQNTKQILTKLVEKGFVELVPDEADGRVSRVVATEKLSEWGQKTEDESKRFMAEMYAGLSKEELGTLASGLMRIHETLGQMDPKEKK